MISGMVQSLLTLILHQSVPQPHQGQIQWVQDTVSGAEHSPAVLWNAFAVTN